MSYFSCLAPWYLSVIVILQHEAEIKTFTGIYFEDFPGSFDEYGKLCAIYILR